MRKAYKLLLAIVLGAMLILPLVACNKDEPNPNPTEDTITITDSVGRMVSIDGVPDKVAVLDHYSAEVMRALGTSDKIVAVCNYMIQEGVSYWGNLASLPNIGMYNDLNTNNIETMKMNGVQLVLTNDIGWSKTVEMLENANLKVAVINCYKPLEYSTDVKNLGKLLGKEQKASELANYYDGIMKVIANGIASIPENELKTVYYEGANMTSVGNTSGWHEVIVLAGGINIYGDVSGGTISATEATVQKNPDYIWRYYNGNMTPNQSEMQSAYNDIVNRSGWSNMSALKNNDVFVLNYWAAKGYGKLYAIAVLAEMLYPDVFSELDAESIAQKWYTEYQGVAFNEGHLYFPGA